jgi:sulfite exporter TauE/SafE
MYYLSGFLVGIMGSLHCFGMCSPLSMVMQNHKFLAGKLVYNFGRVITYSLLGLLVGFLGQLVAMGGIQQVLSIGAGVFILSAAIFPVLARKMEGGHAGAARFVSWLKQSIGRFIGRKGLLASLSVGMLNGLLPCGLVYLALAGAALAGSMESGAIYMLAFGLGTFPMMLAAATIGRGLQHRFSLNLNKVYPVFLGILGLIFILRGLNLGIPYLSPELLLNGDQGITDC